MGSFPHWKTNEDLSMNLKGKSDEFHIQAKSLNIVWGKDHRFWEWIEIPQEPKSENFKEGAVLKQVNWLEVMGKLTVTSSVPTTTICEIYYKIKFRVDAFGWDSVPVKFKINVEGKETERREKLERYTKNTDTWYEINGGEFSVPANDTMSLSFAMLEHESEWWKGGLILAGVTIKPKQKGNEGPTAMNNGVTGKNDEDEDGKTKSIGITEE